MSIWLDGPPGTPRLASCAAASVASSTKPTSADSQKPTSRSSTPAWEMVCSEFVQSFSPFPSRAMCPQSGTLATGVHNVLVLPIILVIILVIIMLLEPPVAIIAALDMLEARRLALEQLEFSMGCLGALRCCKIGCRCYGQALLYMFLEGMGMVGGGAPTNLFRCADTQLTHLVGGAIVWGPWRGTSEK